MDDDGYVCPDPDMEWLIKTVKISSGQLEFKLGATKCDWSEILLCKSA